MKLLLKFNLVFLLVFALGLAAASLIARGVLQKAAMLNPTDWRDRAVAWEEDMVVDASLGAHF